MKTKICCAMEISQDSSFFIHSPFQLSLCSRCIGVVKLHFIRVGCNVPKLIIVSSL